MLFWVLLGQLVSSYLFRVVLQLRLEGYLTEVTAVESAGHGIRVNCLCPAWIETPMLRKSMETIPPLDTQTALTGIPMERIGAAKEVAQSAIFLCSTWSSFITGQALAVDGGMTII